MAEKKVRVAIIGVGNCASSLVQGVEYYKDAAEDASIPGIMHVNLGGYHIRDIEFTLGIDINVTKVGTTSITMEYGLWRDGDPDRLLARGSSVVVLVDYATGTKIPLPQEMRVRLSAL